MWNLLCIWQFNTPTKCLSEEVCWKVAAMHWHNNSWGLPYFYQGLTFTPRSLELRGEPLLCKTENTSANDFVIIFKIFIYFVGVKKQTNLFNLNSTSFKVWGWNTFILRIERKHKYERCEILSASAEHFILCQFYIMKYILYNVIKDIDWFNLIKYKIMICWLALLSIFRILTTVKSVSKY